MTIRDADGNLLYQVFDYEPKDFLSAKPNGNLAGTG